MQVQSKAAPPFVLSDVDHRVRHLDDICSQGPALLAFVERDCPTSLATLRALAATGARMVVISEGRAEAARDLAATAGAEHLTMLVETAPYAVSAAYGLTTVPTLVLVDGDGNEADRCVGWDRDAVARLVDRAGGDTADFGSGMPEHKPGCGSRNTYDEQMQQVLEADDAALAPAAADDGIDEMWERGWTDGLPVVPPTRARVDAMLGNRDGTRSLGEVPPTMGELTLERLAACAVLAGCRPEYFPVVIAAAEAVLEPAFNLHGLQNTTHMAAPVIVVNGPVRRALGMNPGSNVLGFGNRANVTIGRAVRLMMCLTGGATAGRLDQSTIGGPHKFGWCIPENEEVSRWEPLHVQLGHAPETSTVTVIASEGPSQVSDHFSQTPEGVANTLTQALQSVWAPTWYPVGADTVLVICPEHMQMLADAGWSKDDLRTWIFTHAQRSAGDIRASGSGEFNAFAAQAESDDTMIPKFLSPEEIIIVVAGGVGRFSAVLGPWVGVGLGSSMCTRTIDWRP